MEKVSILKILFDLKELSEDKLIHSSWDFIACIQKYHHYKNSADGSEIMGAIEFFKNNNIKGLNSQKQIKHFLKMKKVKISREQKIHSKLSRLTVEGMPFSVWIELFGIETIDTVL